MPFAKPRPKVPKTKTFGGCWTCRRRKVKCDNVRPRCCRCSKDFQCEGYDIELFWVPSGSAQEFDMSTKGRKAMLLHDERIPTSCKVAEVHEMLVWLNEAEKEWGIHIDHEIGPFSVFSTKRALSYSMGCASRDINSCGTTAVETTRYCDDSNSSIPADLIEEICFDMDLAIETEDPQMEIELIDQSSTVVTDSSTFPHLFDFEIRTHYFSDTTTRELMHNYINVVADLLQPASHSQNPYKSIYVPTAMIGSAEGLGGVGMLEVSHSNVAVFHAILSVSAFHLRGTDSLPERVVFDKLGRLHRGKAFESLQIALLDELDRPDHNAAISAMLSLVSSDLMDGGMSEFWIHLDGCERLQQSIPDMQSLQEPYKQLHNVCAFMKIMARSTQQDFAPLPWPDFETYEDLLAHIASPFIIDDHSLEFTYGITATLASLIYITTKLHHHILYYTANDLTLPDSLHTTVNDHGDAITNWSLAKESFSSIQPTDCDTLAIIQHHAIAFHRAICIHFHTLILPTCPTVIASYSQTTVENLIAAESLKRANGARYRWKSMAPVVWPGFIASCEADLKDRVLWRSWWTSVQKYRIGSIARLWGVVREVWDGRDDGSLEIPGWAPILRTHGLRVMSGG